MKKKNRNINLKKALMTGAVSTVGVGLVQTMSATQVFAAEQYQSQELQDLLNEAKALGLNVNEQASTHKENRTEADADQKEQIANIRRTVEAYKKAKEKYDQQTKVAEENKTKPGYLSEVVPKNLIFESEPNAKVTISGQHMVSKDAWANAEMEPNVKWRNPNRLDYEGSGAGTYTTDEVADHAMLMRVGDSVTATYTNLENSSYMGKKIASVKFTTTLKETVGPLRQVALQFLQDPTVTMFAHAWTNGEDFGRLPDFRFTTKIQYFDENGQEIFITEDNPALISFASLNSQGGQGEYVANFNGRYIPINGSGITEQNGKVTNFNNKSLEDIAREQGAPDGRWDDLSLKHAYVGAIAGRANKSIEFDWGNHGSAQWLAINTRSVSNTEVPVPPKNGEFEIDFHKNTVTAAPVNVKYVNIENPSEEVATPETINGNEGDDYTTTQKDVQNFEFVRVDGDTKGKLSNQGNTVTYYYKKLVGNVKVKHEWDDGTPLTEAEADGLKNGEALIKDKAVQGEDYAASKLADKILSTKKEGTKSYNFKRQYVGLKQGSAAETGKVEAKKTKTVTFVYKKTKEIDLEKSMVNYGVNVHFEDTKGKVVKDKAVIFDYAKSVLPLGKFNQATPVYDARKLKADNQTITTPTGDLYGFKGLKQGSAPENGQVKQDKILDVVYQYERLYKTSWKDENGNSLLKEYTGNSVKGKEELKDKNYEYVTSKPDKNGNVTHVYRLKRGSVQVFYKDINKDENGEQKSIADTVTFNGSVKDSYKTDQKDVPGWRFLKVEGDTTGTFPDGTSKKVTYYYEKLLQTRYISDVDGDGDGQGDELAESVTDNKFHEKKDFDNYKFLYNEEHDNIKTYVYHLMKTSFVDTEGNKIDETVDGVQPKKDIEGWEYVNTIPLQNGDVNHVYKKKEVPPTPEPEKPAEKPVEKPKVQNKELPKTGAEALGMQFAGGLAALGLGGGTLFKRRKK